jgi:ribonuclease HI
MGDLITAVSDASFLPDGRAGFAFYLIGAGIPGSYYSGPFQKPVEGNNHAELLAAVNALHQATVAAQAAYSAVLLQSDSLYALQVLLTYFGGCSARGTKGRNAALFPFSHGRRAERHEKAAVKAVQKVLRPSQLLLRHVPGHGKDGGTARGYVNRQCDMLARAAAKGKD